MSKHLLAISPKKYTASEIGYLKRDVYNSNYLYRSLLPQFCINEKFQCITEADGYLQFVEEGDEEFILFDTHTIDDFLQEEMNHSNMLFDDDSVITGSDVELFISILKNHAYIAERKEILPPTEYVIININYFGGGYPDYEYDVEYSIDGFLNKDLEIIKFNLDEQRSK